ncbi:uncharacterized protein C16orf46 homolog [Rhinophrynus dorsalis]
MASHDMERKVEKSEDADKIQEKYCCPEEGKAERQLTEELADISDRLLEDDQHSTRCLIETGWEEAVCGWGTISATAGLYLQKKSRRLKSGSDLSCIICLDICQVTYSKNKTLEAKTITDSNGKETPESNHSHSDNVLPPAVEALTSGDTDHCPTAMVSKTENRDKATHTGVVNKEQRQCKNTSERCTSLVVIKDINPVLGIPVCVNSCDSKETLFSLPVVLPPLKAPAVTGPVDQMVRKNKEVLIHQLEKFPSKNIPASSLYSQVINNVELKGERRLVDTISELPREQYKVPDTQSFIMHRAPKTPIKNSELLYWQCSLLSHKASTVIPSAIPFKQNSSVTSVGLLHTRTMQSKRNMRQDIRQLNEAKLRNRAKSGNSLLLTSPRLPSLTVTRVAIPVIAPRPL